ncbi:MAG: hypothetical protein JWN39_3383 [Ilumatobacteraceae bacterium]|nr:hypothetical protein [Ilumatobacteraceae bacterium]
MKKITTPRSTRARLAIGGALTLAIGLGGALTLAHADAGASQPSSLVSITPCRLVDTRADQSVGMRSSPLAAAETADFAVWGTNGNCTIPATATGIVSNVTAVNGTAGSFLTVYPGDAAQPLSSNLNWTAKSPATPNLVTVGLSATGGIKAFNHDGNVDVIIDIVGYYQPSAAGGAGGASGPQGPQGPQGPASYDKIPSGKTVVGFEAYDADATAPSESHNFIVHLPGKAGVNLTDATVNFANTFTTNTPENDVTCTGTYAAPTAPAGKVCLYLNPKLSLNKVFGFGVSVLKDTAFDVAVNTNLGENYVDMTWAYTAP